ncbi:MAG: hypothetical protein FWD71_21155 [Oscillospiraceae bacterium]|nr:hypothetical protein [Oscillospiraceae bacterium]
MKNKKMIDFATMIVGKAIKENTAKIKKETRIETAKKMLLDNMPVDEVKTFTGLTEEDVKEIEKQIQK